MKKITLLTLIICSLTTTFSFADFRFGVSDKDSIITEQEVEKNNFSISSVMFKKQEKKSFQDRDLLFSNENLQVSQAFPNPASNFTQIKYNILNRKVKAKVTITNLLGKEVANYQLIQEGRKIRIPTVDFDSGIYFYRLYINGKIVKAKKLIVKHH